MKQKTIILPHCELMLIEVPENSGFFSIGFGCLYYSASPMLYSEDPEMTFQRLPKGNWQILSLIDKDTPLSEENASKIVDKSKGWFERYKDGAGKFHWAASESFSSLLKREGVYFENPMGERPNIFECFHDNIIYEDMMDAWEMGQKDVWGKTAVLIKPINNK